MRPTESMEQLQKRMAAIHQWNPRFFEIERERLMQEELQRGERAGWKGGKHLLTQINMRRAASKNRPPLARTIEASDAMHEVFQGLKDPVGVAKKKEALQSGPSARVFSLGDRGEKE